IRRHGSHAVHKRPTPGDFRVQWQFCGDTVIAEPAAQTVARVISLLALLPEQPLYARVDGIECDRAFVLMEIELIEPVLFLGIASASERFARRIADDATSHASKS